MQIMNSSSKDTSWFTVPIMSKVEIDSQAEWTIVEKHNEDFSF